MGECVVGLWSVVQLMRFRERFGRTKPDVLALAHLVEVQLAFVAVRTGRAEYVFLPKLRSICLLDRVVERVSNPKRVNNRMLHLVSRITTHLSSRCCAASRCRPSRRSSGRSGTMGVLRMMATEPAVLLRRNSSASVWRRAESVM